MMADMMNASSSQCYQCSVCGYASPDLTELIMHACSKTTETGVDPLEVDLSQSQSMTPCMGINNPLEKWEDKHVRLLMECYLKHKDLFGKPHLTKKKVFEKIAEEFNRISDVVVSGDQCFRKWKKLETKQKEIEDNNAQTGREKKTWKFHREMEECLGKNPSVRPVFTFETSGNSSTASTSSANVSDSDSEGSEEGCKKDIPQGKRLKRKRKSRSSVAEMIDFLKEYSDKREKVEEEKVKVLKAIHEDRKEFFSEFFSYLKDTKK